MTPDQAASAVLAGDHAAYRHIIAAIHGEARLVIAALCPEPARVEACLDEALIAGYHRLAERPSGEGLTGWMLGIARATALAERQACSAREAKKRPYRSEIESALEAETLSRIGPRLGTALDELRGCLGRLKTPVLGIIDDHYLRRVEPTDIARAHERSGAWVRVLLLRTRGALAACLREKGVLGGS